jgi:exosortase/archaeosortase family protein
VSRSKSAHKAGGSDGNRRTSALRPVIGFVARFGGVWLSALLLLALVPSIEKAAIANTVGSLITLAGWVGFAGSQVSDYLHIGGVAIHIVPDCTPLMPITSLSAAVIAFPAPLAWRAGGLLVGATILWFYNLLRIYALMLVLAFKPGWFDFIHVYLWQTVTLIVVFAMFVLWLHLQAPTPSESPTPDAG